MAAIATFGITAESVRGHHFPYLPQFSVSSSPTLAIVNEKVVDCAGELSAALVAQSITPADIEGEDDTYAPYVSCRAQLRLMVAIEVMEDMTAKDAAVLEKWRKKVDAWFERLLEHGADFLGDSALTTSASDPQGPTSHISEYGLDIGTPTVEASNVIPPFRKDDCL